ncbi:hypothetical protein HN014_07675 [Aquimarina sp. TRL1]|uniref:DUF3592 domain-containing protein n=1 Tax=Aquimarina sp. (strain TRL1) TaxID=2736252 RepID=UPI0015884AE4|nr:DUF3592 domain-containing protein [Aquimarina sp. TRL1]QKX04798.1 hypothetical protein HN014_07675 [Aquimarina sp. TRL1]
MKYMTLFPVLVLLTIAIVFITVSIRYLKRLNRMIKKGTIIDATIIDYVEHYMDDHFKYFPKVTFKNKKGKNITTRLETGYGAPKNNIGTTVKVLYTIDESGHYDVLSSLRGWKWFGYSFMILGIISLIWGLWTLYVNYQSIP